jgi:hypothetical protein
MCEDPFIAAPVDRRTSSRQAATIPVAILAKDWSVFAVLEDISESGALLLTQEPVDVGTSVEIHVLLGSQVRPQVKASATVVRSAVREGGHILWSHEVAVHYEAQHGPWDEALTAVADRQAELRRTDA